MESKLGFLFCSFLKNHSNEKSVPYSAIILTVQFFVLYNSIANVYVILEGVKIYWQELKEKKCVGNTVHCCFALEARFFCK